MPSLKKLIDFNRTLSEKFSFGIGVGSHPNALNSNEHFFREQLRVIIRDLSLKFNNEPVRILDIGCGKHTHLESLTDIHNLISAWGMDISADELRVNPFIKQTIIHDACCSDFETLLDKFKGHFHLVISHNVLEHVREPAITHAMVNFLLKPGGIAFHSYPTLFDPLMTASQLIPLKLAEKILFFVEPFRAGPGKFPTYYHKNRAFSQKLERWFETLGFEHVHHRDYWGTAYLYSIFPLQWVMDLFYWVVLKTRLKFFCSHSIITLRKKQEVK
jgi:2-polyprenyl-3-methyl-5-hydroxy-6-metoxy-1,4-benzoquinol methylase